MAGTGKLQAVKTAGKSRKQRESYTVSPNHVASAFYQQPRDGHQRSRSLRRLLLRSPSLWRLLDLQAVKWALQDRDVDEQTPTSPELDGKNVTGELASDHRKAQTKALLGCHSLQRAKQK